MTDFTENFDQYAIESAAPPVYFGNDAWYAGLTGSEPQSLPRGAAVLILQLPTTGQTLNKEIQVTKAWETPRVPGASRLTFSALEDISGDLAITNLPSTDSFFYGPFTSTGNPAAGGDPFVPYSSQSGSYAASYSNADVSRLTLPVCFKVGVSCLELGGCINAFDFFNATGHAGYYEAIYYSYSGSPIGSVFGPSGLTSIVNFSGLTSVTGGGYANINICSTVTVDPPQDPCTCENMTFLIKKGTTWPGNYSIIDKCTSEPITNPTIKQDHCNPDLLLTDQFFEDWEFCTEKYTLSESTVFERYNNDDDPAIVIRPCTELTLAFTVTSVLELDTEDLPDGSLLNFLTAISDGSLSLYFPSGDGMGYYQDTVNFDPPYGSMLNVTTPIDAPSDRNLDLFGTTTVIPRGSSWPCSFTTDVGMRFPPSMIIPAGSSVIASTNADPGSPDTAVQAAAGAVPRAL